eukprot:1793216-Rhodomonas_salina.1
MCRASSSSSAALVPSRLSQGLRFMICAMESKFQTESSTDCDLSLAAKMVTVTSSSRGCSVASSSHCRQTHRHECTARASSELWFGSSQCAGASYTTTSTTRPSSRAIRLVRNSSQHVTPLGVTQRNEQWCQEFGVQRPSLQLRPVAQTLQ